MASLFPDIPEPVEKTDFDRWLAELDKAAVSAGVTDPGEKPYSEQTGLECWLGYFEDGLTPEEALDEDASYG